MTKDRNGAANGSTKTTMGSGMPAPPPARAAAKTTAAAPETNSAHRAVVQTPAPSSSSVGQAIKLTIPLATGETIGHCTRQITINDLTHRQTEVYNRLWKRLIADGTVMTNGRLVSNQHQYDAIRWLLDKIADEAGI